MDNVQNNLELTSEEVKSCNVCEASTKALNNREMKGNEVKSHENLVRENAELKNKVQVLVRKIK